jgi:RNA polymerase sigma-70 factor (ECF subfamily)
MQSSGMILCRRPARALAYKDQWQPGTHLNSWMFRNNLWFDRTRAKKFRSESLDIEVADFLAGSDGWAVAESKLALPDLLKALDQLSPESGVDSIGV